MTATFHVESIRTLDALRALEADWHVLLAESRSPSVFLRPEWIVTWWEIFGDTFDLAFRTVRDDAGALVGLAPLMTGRGPGRLSRRLRHLMVIGQQGDTLAEHLDLVVRTGYESRDSPDG